MAKGKSTAKKTTNHAEIKRWVENRSGRLTSVKGIGNKDEAGILRIDFAEDDQRLENISWDELFEKFEDAKLALLYQEEPAQGGESHFAKSRTPRGDGQSSSLSH